MVTDKQGKFCVLFFHKSGDNLEMLIMPCICNKFGMCINPMYWSEKILSIYLVSL